jgi:hypothetical protein
LPYFLAALSPIKEPSICATPKELSKSPHNPNVDKSYCYVKIDATYDRAKKICQSKGMQLYKADSESAIEQLTSNFSYFQFGGLFADIQLSKKAVVFIDGRKGNKCQTINGHGKIKDDWCTTSYHFICEFIDKDKQDNYLKRN